MRSTTLLAVRRSAVEALGNFGPAAKPAVSELLRMLNNNDETTRVNAAVALWKIARHPKAVPALWRCFAAAIGRRPILRRSPWAKWSKRPARSFRP